MKEKNVNNLTKTLAVMSLLVPVTSQALGIGDIELHSALNQKLNAEVKLHLSGENPSDISVRLAAPEKFDQAGIPWSYFLSKIRFEPVIQTNGSVIVKISSKDALTEPFLNFLLEVSWPQGSLYREFTLLIDPPADYQSPYLPSASSESGYQNDTSQAIAERPIRKSRRVAKRAVNIASAITPETPTSGEYGPTRHQDTLWGIADRLGKERGIATQAMMEALFQANPEAFSHGDMDSLKAGVSLQIPASDAIAGAGTHTPSRKATVEHPTSSASKALELVAPTEAKITENARITEQAKSANGTNASDLNANASGKDLELQSRIEKLEQQLNMMQQLLALKDQQLAALQHKESTPSQVAAPAAVSPATPVNPVAEVPASPVAVEPPGQPTPPTTPVVPPQKAETPKPEAPKPQTQAPQTTADEDSSSYYWGIGSSGAGILGLLGWLWWRKRKIEEQTNTDSMFASASQIRMPDSEGSLSVPVMDMASAASYDVGTVGESSFISDFTPSDFDAFDTDQGEVDPMSEADVYLAYGRYQQAEELIRDAIHEQPSRDDYKLKLLEILYANESKESFIAYAQELASNGKQENASFWSKVCEMGKELAPESVLFGGTIAINDISPESSQKTANDDLNDFNIPDLTELDLINDINDALSAHASPTEAPESVANDNGLDFDLNHSDDFAINTELDNTASNTQLETIDFDLSSPTLDSATSKSSSTASPQAPKAAIDDDLEQFDFNFDLDLAGDQSKSASNKDTEENTLASDQLEGFEFPDFGAASTDDQIPSASETSKQSKDFDFNFDFDAPLTADTETDDIDFGVSDLTDMDEFETKIDLAKAYIDMGDNDAARSIAEEVLAKGNKDQKFAAQAILDDLA